MSAKMLMPAKLSDSRRFLLSRSLTRPTTGTPSAAWHVQSSRAAARVSTCSSAAVARSFHSEASNCALSSASMCTWRSLSICSTWFSLCTRRSPCVRTLSRSFFTSAWRASICARADWSSSTWLFFFSSARLMARSTAATLRRSRSSVIPRCSSSAARRSCATAPRLCGSTGRGACGTTSRIRSCSAWYASSSSVWASARRPWVSARISVRLLICVSKASLRVPSSASRCAADRDFWLRSSLVTSSSSAR
mmetsp:Transcript_5249/g.17393  ORF Transcript_5249/g.17393 Transcript_5249/m.17393 type:complete len:250 (-) Transcript_5249:1058-1807(-)